MDQKIASELVTDGLRRLSTTTWLNRIQHGRSIDNNNDDADTGRSQHQQESESESVITLDEASAYLATKVLNLMMTATNPRDPQDTNYKLLLHYSEACLQRADEMIQLVPFQKVGLTHRAFFEAASIQRSLALLMYYLSGITIKDSPYQDAISTLQEASKVMDMAILVSGCPFQKDYVLSVIEGIQQAIQSHLDLKPLPSSLKEMDIQEPAEIRHHPLRYPVPELSNPPSLVEFAERYVKTGNPVVLRGAVCHWPSISKESEKRWTLHRLRSIIGGRMVPVEIGSKYTDDGWGQSIMTGAEFIDGFLVKDQSKTWEASTGLGALVASEDDLRARKELKRKRDEEDLKNDTQHEETESRESKRTKTSGPSSNAVGYLAQHDLFAQIPSLQDDIVIPDYCYWAFPDDNRANTNTNTDGNNKDKDSDTDDEVFEENEERKVITSAWFGPEGTVSPLHTDPHRNLFAQAVGWKYLRLYSPEQTPNVYPHEESILGNTSQVDVENPNLEEFPRFADATYMECYVGPGDLLFIPDGGTTIIASLLVFGWLRGDY
ncbi:Lysine-specific demethylase 8 [Blyttiomyces sp. JEL0837]|nr:Lysine-specific demethylase 8 [Blyttiomyces sp. JEL0837]